MPSGRFGGRAPQGRHPWGFTEQWEEKSPVPTPRNLQLGHSNPLCVPGGGVELGSCPMTKKKVREERATRGREDISEEEEN